MARAVFRKVITNQELVAQITPENLRLVEHFLSEKRIRSSETTVAGYRSDLNIFFVWNLLHNGNKAFVSIRKIEYSSFFSFCVSELRWSSARFGRMRSCLSSFSDFIERYMDDEYPDFRNVILRAVDPMPKLERHEKTVLDDKQIYDILSHLTSTGRTQQACWLALAVASGSRFSELLRFTTDHIDEHRTVFDGLFLETVHPIKTKGRTRQGKMMRKFIIKEIFWPYYQRWLSEREEILRKSSKTHNFIFINSSGAPAKSGAARGWSDYIGRYLGVNFYPHCLRHYIVTHMTRLGLPPELIVEIMGWSSAEMYKVYNDLTAKNRDWPELEKLREYLLSRAAEGTSNE